MSDDKNRIDELARDIEFLKTAVNRGHPVVRDVLGNFREHISLVVVISILFMLSGFGFQAVIFYYGSFAAVPPIMALAGVGTIVAIFILTSIWKMIILTKMAKSMEGSGLTLPALVAQFFSGSLLHTQIAFGISLFAAGVFLAWKGEGWYLMPLFAAYFGVSCNHYASNYDLPEFRITGYASIVIGIAILPLIDFAPFFCFGLLLGGALLSFALAFKFSSRGRPGKMEDSRHE